MEVTDKQAIHVLVEEAQAQVPKMNQERVIYARYNGALDLFGSSS